MWEISKSRLKLQEIYDEDDGSIKDLVESDRIKLIVYHVKYNLNNLIRNK